MKQYFFFIYLLGALILVGCTIHPTHPTLQQEKLPELIPVRKFVANTASKWNYKISPDGKKISWLAVHGTKVATFVRILGENKTMVFPTYSANYRWAQDNQHLLLDLDGHIYILDIEKPNQPNRDLTPFSKGWANFHSLLPNDPEHILILHNQRTQHYSTDLYRFNLNTGKYTMIAQNPGDIRWWITNVEGEIKARLRNQGEKVVLEARHKKEPKQWLPIYHFVREDAFQVLSLSKDEKGIWIITNHNRDKTSLIYVDIVTQKEKVVYEHPSVDIDGIFLNQNTKEPYAITSNPDYPNLHFLDEQLEKDFVTFQSENPTNIYFSSHSLDERWFIVETFTDRTGRFYLYDRIEHHKTLLAEAPLSSYQSALSKTQPISFQSQDNLTIHGYLTLPEGSLGKSLPTILLIHGGPWERYYWPNYRFSSFRQFLANRGYAILQINFRGSSGYGRSFKKAGSKEIGRKMQQDLIDGVQWAIEQGVADPKKIAIMGASYGGYATLVGLSFTPDQFACGVDISGFGDLPATVETLPGNFMSHWHEYAGDPTDPDDRKRMKEQSPLYRVNQITKPVLIIHGTKDSVVPIKYAEQMVQALKKAGKSVEYLPISGEGHSFQHWKNNLKIYRTIEDFLGTCLGGRSSGFDYFQLGAWVF
ncbi:MAG: S9 family peptidase [Nitrospinae bacterium]|nr:S9 family peptidase [Nitrospinota bacterium]